MVRLFSGCVSAVPVQWLLAHSCVILASHSTLAMMESLTDNAVYCHAFLSNPAGPARFTSWRHGHASPNSQWLTI